MDSLDGNDVKDEADQGQVGVLRYDSKRKQRED